MDFYYEQWASCGPIDQEVGSQAAIKKARAMTRIQQSLIAAQELGDEKLQIVTQLQELIDHKTRQLEHDFSNLDYGKDDAHLMDTHPSNGSFYPSNANHHNAASNHTSHSNSPSAIASPIHASNAPSSSFHAAAASSIATSGGSGSVAMVHATSERYNSTSSGNGSKDTGERSSKRPRRARNDNGSANSGEATGSGDNSTSAADNVHTKSAVSATAISTSGTLATSANSTPAAKKNNSGTIASGLTGSSATTGSSGTSTSAATNSSSGGASNRKQKQKRKSGRAGQTGSGAASTGSTASGGAQAGSLTAGSGRDRDVTPPQEEAIDPDEPTYCLCDQISFGEMILCDNDLCPIEWFHFSCVSLLSKPKGKWFCPNCRGDRPNVMKPKAQFLKELERYNKEKEEKT